MVWCRNCGKNVHGIPPYDGALYALVCTCDLCGRILEKFNFSTEVTLVKNAARQSERDIDYSSVSKSEKQCSEKGEGEKYGDAEASDESGNFSDTNDADEVDGNVEEIRLAKIIWEEMNGPYLLEQAALKEAKNAPPQATAMEDVCRTLQKKVEKSPKRLKTKTDMEEKKKEVKSNEHENGKNEEQ